MKSRYTNVKYHCEISWYLSVHCLPQSLRNYKEEAKIKPSEKALAMPGQLQQRRRPTMSFLTTCCLIIENRRSPIWQLCRHWWHRKLSLRQLTVSPVTTKLWNWRPFVFIDADDFLIRPCDNTRCCYLIRMSYFLIRKTYLTSTISYGGLLQLLGSVHQGPIPSPLRRQRPDSIKSCRLTNIGNPIVEIRRS